MTATSEVFALNKNTGHLGSCTNGCGCGGARHEAGALVLEGPIPRAPTPPTPDASESDVRAKMIEWWKRDHPGKPVPGYLSAAGNAALKSTDLVGALKSLWQTLVRMDAHADRIGNVPPQHDTEATMSDTRERTKTRTRHYLAPNGELVEYTSVVQKQEYAAPRSPWGDNAVAKFPDAKNPDGDPHGDAAVIRRRRATELQRLIDANRKLAHANARGSAEARARWDVEYEQLSAELKAILETEREERDGLKKF